MDAKARAHLLGCTRDLGLGAMLKRTVTKSKKRTAASYVRTLRVTLATATKPGSYHVLACLTTPWRPRKAGKHKAPKPFSGVSTCRRPT